MSVKYFYILTLITVADCLVSTPGLSSRGSCSIRKKKRIFCYPCPLNPIRTENSRKILCGLLVNAQRAGPSCFTFESDNYRCTVMWWCREEGGDCQLQNRQEVSNIYSSFKLNILHLAVRLPVGKSYLIRIELGFPDIFCTWWIINQ